MTKQTRAAETRQKVIDTAVELFTDQGYAETGINDITASAGISPGAFYYHFDSKEALANEIVQQGWPKAWAVFRRCTDSPSPGLENVITMTFSLSELMKNDKSVWIANNLNAALSQLSGEGRRGFRQRASTFVDGVVGSLSRSDIREGIALETVGNMVWVMVHGCHLLSDAMTDSVYVRLAQSWHMVLPSIVEESALSYFQHFVTRTQGRHEPMLVDELTAKRQALLDTRDEETA